MSAHFCAVAAFRRAGIFIVLGVAIAALQLGGIAHAHAAQPGLVSRAILFGNPTKEQGQISPDGKWSSWLAPKDGVLNVWVARTNTPAKAWPVTNETHRPIRRYFWARSSRFILFFNDRGGDENYLLYGVRPTGGAVRAYTAFRDTRVNLVGTSRSRPSEILIGVNNRDRRFHDVHLLNVETGEIRLILENNRFQRFIADDSLKVRFAFKARDDGGSDVIALSERGEAIHGTIPAEDSINTKPVGLSHDGKTLYWLDSRGRDKTALVAEDLETRESRVLGESAKADIDQVLRNPTTGVAEAFSIHYLRDEWFAIDPAMEPDLVRLSTRFAGPWQLVDRNDQNTIWVISVDEIVRPKAFYLYDRPRGTIRRMFDTRPQLARLRLAPMKGVEIKARDGLVLPSFLTLPIDEPLNQKGNPTKPLPLVLNVHGGPWLRDKLGYDEENQWLANRGYAVLQVNYRGSTGFGKRFVEAANREIGGKMHDDLLDAVKWAVDQGIAIESKVAIYGLSYGGYATLFGLAFTPTTFACGVDIVGPSSLVTVIESFPEYWKPTLQGTWYRRVGNPAIPEDRKFLLSRSPIARVNQIQRPLLIAQGANDPRVPQRESDRLVAEMRAQGKPVTYALYLDEGHVFTRPESMMSFHAIAEGFLSKCLGGRYEPIGNALDGANIEIRYGVEMVPGLERSLASKTRNRQALKH